MPELSIITGLIGTIVGKVTHLLVAKNNRRQQLKMAAIDKRLQVHQEAYTLWRKLRHAAAQMDPYETVTECQEWWNANCLYLTEEAREAFPKAYIAAGDFSECLKRHEKDSRLRRKTWHDIIRAGPIIIRGVHLPPIGEDRL